MFFFAFSWLLARIYLDLYSWTKNCFLFGLACRPADSSFARFVFCVLEGTPILAGGDWCRSRGGWVFLLSFFSGFEQLRVSEFACNATGLDAVQRLEQKKYFGLFRLPNLDFCFLGFFHTGQDGS